MFSTIASIVEENEKYAVGYPKGTTRAASQGDPGLGSGSLGDSTLSMSKALGSSPSPRKRNRENDLSGQKRGSHLNDVKRSSVRSVCNNVLFI